MPLKLEIKRKLSARSDRVKCVDLHATEPWMVASLYNGNVHIWNYENQQLIKTFEICDLPVRAAKFIARKNWLVTGSDDMQVRVYNYNTLERVHQFEAHSDYIRSIAVHPTQPFILTSSDDMLIKLWDWDKKWTCAQTFEGHTHYVMQIVFNPKDSNTFASASLDRTIKVWQLGSSVPNFTLEGHEKGVNCVDYYHGGDKPYLISGADDRLVKIWDYQNKTCVQTLEGHAQNVSAVAFHPELPIILTCSEDGTVRIWHVNTYRLENTLNYGLERVWTVVCLKGSNHVALGFDEGSVLIKLGREFPAMSMDNGGRIVWAKHNEMQQANIKTIGPDQEIKDGERLPLQVKDTGSCEVYPQIIAHNPNGRFVVVCGDGEYIIYTAMALRNKSFGAAQEFVWAAHDSSMYAIRDSSNSIKVFKNFKEVRTFKPDYGAEGIFGGFLLGAKTNSGLALYDWEGNNTLVRRIEISAKGLFWNETGTMLAIAAEESFFVLNYSAEAIERAKSMPEKFDEDGISDALDLVKEVEESIRTAIWVGDCLLYTNGVNRLNYYVGGEIVTVAHLDRQMTLLGYQAKDNRVYLGDKELSVVSYSLLQSVLQYQTAVMRKDFVAADKELLHIPKEQRTRIAHFLEKQGFKPQALAVTCDQEHKFDLALQLAELKIAYQIAKETPSVEKWRQLADLATNKGEFGLAQECLRQANDFGGQLLLATSAGSDQLTCRIADEAHAAGQDNVAFTAYFITGQLDKCLDLLITSKRLPEAALFARTYLPNRVSAVVALWRDQLRSSVSERAAQSLADPAQYENLFAGFRDAVKTEQFLAAERRQSVPAAAFSQKRMNWHRQPVQEMLEAEAIGQFVYDPSLQSDVGREPVVVSTNDFAAKRNLSPPRLSPPAAQPARETPPKPVGNSADEDIDDLKLDEMDLNDVDEADIDVNLEDE